jgi:hypothetical protein
MRHSAWMRFGASQQSRPRAYSHPASRTGSELYASKWDWCAPRIGQFAAQEGFAFGSGYRRRRKGVPGAGSVKVQASGAPLGALVLDGPAAARRGN